MDVGVIRESQFTSRRSDAEHSYFAITFIDVMKQYVFILELLMSPHSALWRGQTRVS
jgi:hypothetical protein